MDGLDRTDQLISAMLDRRAGQPVPDGLTERTIAAVATEPQVAGRAAGRASPVTIGRLAAAAAAVVLVVGGLAAGRLLADVVMGSGPDASPGAIAGAPTPSPEAASLQPSEVPSSPQAARSPRPGAFPPDSLAVVTRRGFDLRVRSAPGLGPESEMLEPLLDARTRMLILDGPVAADGYEWYEVLVEDGPGRPDAMYGWVASGKGGTAWIRRGAVECGVTPTAADVVEKAPFEFLVCYGPQEVTLDARWNEAQDGVDVECPWLNGGPCEIAQGWLLGSVYVSHRADDGTRDTIALAVPPALRASMDEVPGDATMTLTVAMDAPEARECRITDPTTGEDLIAPSRVVTVCRLAFVVRAVDWAP